jgi:telomerase protein component 1
VIIPEHMPDLPLLAKYRTSIDTAIRISTMNNVKPIRGNCAVFCDVSGSMRNPCSTKGRMGSVQTVFDIAILLGLMLQDVCDSCDFRIFSSPGPTTKKRCDIAVALEANTILDNIKRVTKASELLGGGTDFPYDYLQEMISKKTKIDTFIILSDMMIAPGKSEMEVRGNTVTKVLERFRKEVNPDMLFVAIDLYGGGKSIVDVNANDPKNVLITGFSDNILRFIAEHGDRKQLDHVLSIDETKGLNRPKKVKKDVNIN